MAWLRRSWTTSPRWKVLLVDCERAELRAATPPHQFSNSLAVSVRFGLPTLRQCFYHLLLPRWQRDPGAEEDSHVRCGYGGAQTTSCPIVSARMWLLAARVDGAVHRLAWPTMMSLIEDETSRGRIGCFVIVCSPTSRMSAAVQLHPCAARVDACFLADGTHRKYPECLPLSLPPNESRLLLSTPFGSQHPAPSLSAQWTCPPASGPVCRDTAR